MSKIIKIGYWRQSENAKEKLPWPTEMIDPNWDLNEKTIVAEYIANTPAVEHWLGYSGCRICQKELGTSCLSDGVFQFPEKYEHYLLEHNVKPPELFIDYVMSLHKEKAK